MHRLLGLTLATLFLFALGASAEVGSQKLVLDPTAGEAPPAFTLLDHNNAAFTNATLKDHWSFLFFGMQSPGWALLEIALLWLAIAATIVTFARIRPWAGGLLLPYWAWVTFAGALNLAIWRMNP